jgi:hypothetical protein
MAIFTVFAAKKCGQCQLRIGRFPNAGENTPMEVGSYSIAIRQFPSAGPLPAIAKVSPHGATAIGILQGGIRSGTEPSSELLAQAQQLQQLTETVRWFSTNISALAQENLQLRQEVSKIREETAAHPVGMRETPTAENALQKRIGEAPQRKSVHPSQKLMETGNAFFPSELHVQIGGRIPTGSEEKEAALQKRAENLKTTASGLAVGATVAGMAGAGTALIPVAGAAISAGTYLFAGCLALASARAAKLSERADAQRSAYAHARTEIFGQVSMSVEGVVPSPFPELPGKDDRALTPDIATSPLPNPDPLISPVDAN